MLWAPSKTGDQDDFEVSSCLGDFKWFHQPRVVAIFWGIFTERWGYLWGFPWPWGYPKKRWMVYFDGKSIYKWMMTRGTPISAHCHMFGGKRPWLKQRIMELASSQNGGCRIYGKSYWENPKNQWDLKVPKSETSRNKRRTVMEHDDVKIGLKCFSLELSASPNKFVPSHLDLGYNLALTKSFFWWSIGTSTPWYTRNDVLVAYHPRKW